jgi:hypothetical protein
LSRARQAGVSSEDAAIAFGCNPETMRRHYIRLDETPISDEVMERTQNAGKLKIGVTPAQDDG